MIKKGYKTLFNYYEKNKKSFFLGLIFVSISVVFSKQISIFLGENIGIADFDENKSIFNKVYLTFIVVFIITLIRYLRKNYKLSKDWNFWIICISIIYYVSLRPSKNLSFHIINDIPFNEWLNKFEIYYSDIIFLLLIFTVILFIRNMLHTIISFIINILSNIYQLLKKKLHTIISFIINILSNIYQRLKKKLTLYIKLLKKKLPDSFISFLKKVFDSIRYFLNKIFETKKSPSNYLKEDLPLNGKISIKNEKVVDKLITTIDGFYPEVAFIIGINAKWGKGKTTFINRFRNKITEKNKKIITFDFNAWKHHDEKSIITNFFGQLNKELSKYNGNASPTINQYVNSLLSINNNSYTKSVKLISDALSSKQSTTEFYTEISEIIKNTTRQIIVFVDDLDRLNKQEIDETLRILRNVANFNNMIFICGVDRDYLEQKGELDRDFLNKIFNLEINLPVQNEKSFLLLLIEYIKETKENILPKKTRNEIIKTLYYKESDDYSSNNINNNQSVFLSDSNSNSIKTKFYKENTVTIENAITIPITPSLFFDSQRAVKKFYNKFIFNIQVLENLEDVNTYDYILFHLLISKYPWIYEQFNDKNLANLLTITNGNNLNFRDKNYENLKLEIDNNKKLNDFDLTIIHSILYELFNPKSSRNYNRINQKRNLPRYLKNNILNESLNYSEINNAIDKLEVNNLIQRLEKNNDDDKKEYLTNIKDEIIKRENLQNIKHFEQVFELFNINNIEINKEEFIDILAWAGENDNINDDNFKNLLNTQVFTNIDNKTGEFLIKLNSHYTSVPNRLRIKSIYLQGNNNESIELKTVNKKYVKDTLIKLFEEYLKKENDLTKIAEMVRSCTDSYFIDLNFHIYNTQITDLFTKYLDDNFNSFLEFKPKRNIYYDFFGEISTDKHAQEEVLKHATNYNPHLLNSKFKPHKRTYLKNGMTNFLKYLSNKKETSNFTDVEKDKIDKIIKIIKNNIAKNQ